MIILASIFCLSVASIFYSYLFYPLLLEFLARKKQPNQLVYSKLDKLPEVSILMALYNEEAVIAAKIESILSNNYPLEKIKILLGSDASTDQTNSIIRTFQKKNPNIIQFFPSQIRRGKPLIINELKEKTSSEILILSDANVLFERDTIFELIKHFKNSEIALVDSVIAHTGVEKSGISVSEKLYQNREIHLKHCEGKLWGSMMGAFGACFAMRRSAFVPVPPNFLVDDFFISMKVLETGKKSINCLKARVLEDISNNPTDEYKRKRRIATGSFQNLNYFSYLFFSRKTPLPLLFTFFSHKILRWFTPFFILLILFNGLILSYLNHFFLIPYTIFLLSVVAAIFDFFLRKIQIHIILLRHLSHFYSSNWALLVGFFIFLKGVKSNIWQPTARHQTKN